MDALKDIFGMPLFPHLYMIPLTFIAGMVAGYSLRGTVDDDEDDKPLKPKVD